MVPPYSNWWNGKNGIFQDNSCPHLVHDGTSILNPIASTVAALHLLLTHLRCTGSSQLFRRQVLQLLTPCCQNTATACETVGKTLPFRPGNTWKMLRNKMTKCHLFPSLQSTLTPRLPPSAWRAWLSAALQQLPVLTPDWRPTGPTPPLAKVTKKETIHTPVVSRKSQMLQNQHLSFGRRNVSFFGGSARPHNRTFAGLHSANSTRSDRSWYPQTSAADCLWHFQLPKRPETKKCNKFRFDLSDFLSWSCQIHLLYHFLCSSEVLDVQTLMKVMVHPFQ